MFKDGLTGISLIEGPIQFGAFNIKSFLWPTLGVVFLVYLIISAILMYHWRKYGMGSRRIFFAQIIYFAGSVGIFTLAIVSLSLMN